MHLQMFYDQLSRALCNYLLLWHRDGGAESCMHSIRLRDSGLGAEANLSFSSDEEPARCSRFPSRVPPSLARCLQTHPSLACDRTRVIFNSTCKILIPTYYDKMYEKTYFKYRTIFAVYTIKPKIRVVWLTISASSHD